MQIVCVRYTLAESTDASEVEREIRAFVSGMRALDARIEYTSQRERDDPRSYVHYGRFPDADVVKALQAQDFFRRFSSWLPSRCAAGPSTTFLVPVASTRSA